MSLISKSLKTANTTGYYIPLGADCSRIVIGARTGEFMVQPILTGGVTTIGTSAGAPANAGDITDYVRIKDGDPSMTFDLSAGYAVANQAGGRLIGVRVYSITAGEVTVYGG